MITAVTLDHPPATRRVWSVLTRPRWELSALAALLLGTAVLYFWGLGAAGWANSYYAAAAQAGTQSWKALLFGSLDSGNAITVDKPPAAMWFMGLSGRLFGFSAFTMLLPQALMGVASVGMLYATVRRTSGAAAGLLAGTVLALTPVAALMFRFNNPDALLVLLLIIAAYATVQALQQEIFLTAVGWMTLTGVIIGFAFLTKMLQAFLPVPALALTFLVAAPFGIGRRIGALLVAGLAVLVSAGWYVALVGLWPADARPYIAGSTDNSLLQLALGYNGIERITGGDGGGPGHGNLFFGGQAGITRLFGPSMGVEISWLLPAALIGLLVMAWLTRREPRTDQGRAALLLWGGWLLVTGAVFSFMDGTVHPYYNVALAPAVAALVGLSVAELWRRRAAAWARVVLAIMLAATAIWAFCLLSRTPDWLPPLRWVLLVAALLLAVALALRAQRTGRATTVLAGLAIVVGLGGSASFAIYNVVHGHASGPGSMSGPPRPGGDHGFGGHGHDGPNVALQKLVADTDNRWAAAAVGSWQVSDLELSTGKSLMAIGGFSGGDNSPTPMAFRQYVGDGAIRYFIAGDRKGPPHRKEGSAAAIEQWVGENFTKLDVGGTTVYDLRRPLS